MNADLEVTFDLNGEPVEVPRAVGVKQGCPLSPTLFLFVMQACLEFLEIAMSADVKLKYRNNTKTEGKEWWTCFEHRLDESGRIRIQVLGVAIC